MPDTSASSVTSELITVNPYAYLEDRATAASADMLIIAFFFALIGLGCLLHASGIGNALRPFGSRFGGRPADTPLWR